MIRGVLALCLAIGFACHANAQQAPSDPQIMIHEGYVEESVCRSCHSDQAQKFSTSHHAHAMAVADDASVLADFNNVRFEQDGVSATFSRRDGRFFVNTEGPDGKPGEFEVKYTFAYEPLQQYLVDIGGGRLQALDIAWDTRVGRWFWLGEGAVPPVGSTYHWTGPFYRWNRTCIDCHSTDPIVGFNEEKGTYRSTYVDTSIGCQSCHGPGAAHVSWARSEPGAATPLANLGLAPMDMQMCVACHSRRTKLAAGYRPGSPFLEHFSPALLRDGLYFPDGQIREEVFEYGSFMQSKMAGAGVTCMDCHRAHEGTVKAEGNALCVQCHTPEPPERFAGFRPGGVFDSPAHTHHPAGSEGAKCVSCHMPERTYMTVDPRRDHSFVIPRPDLSALYDTPNACTTCHVGQTNAWAAETMDGWFGKAWRERPTTAHAFDAAARGDVSAIDGLRQIARDAHAAGIVRATAVSEMGQFGPALVPDIKTAAADVDPLVRVGAAEAAGTLPPELRQQVAGALLGDPSRAVRVAAIRALGVVPPAQLPGDQQSAFEAAVGDLRAFVETNSDVAEAQNTYGLFLTDQGRFGDAEATLRRAIDLDPGFAGARMNLAELYRLSGDNGKSRAAYAEAISVAPANAQLRYGYALALVRDKAIDAAIGELRSAIRLDPANARYVTTLAIALDSVGKTDEALDELHRAIVADGRNPELLGTAIQYGLKLGRYAQTLGYAEALERLQPGDPNLASLIGQLRGVLGQP